MNDEAKRNLRNVMVVALADGKLADEERQFIQQLRVRLGVDEDEFRELVAEFKKDPKRITLPTDPAAAENAVTVLVEAAVANGEVNPAQRALLQRIADHVALPPSKLDEMLAAGISEDDAEELNPLVDDIYASFGQWDAATRDKKIAEVAEHGRAAVMPLLRILESYRTPDGMTDALELKTLMVAHLGQIGDDRATYYLAQQINIGDSDDEFTNSELRGAAAEAMGKIVGQSFTPDQAGVEAARLWWLGPEGKQYDRLAF